MSAGDDVLKAHEHRQSVRRQEEGNWRDIARLIAPEENNFDHNSTQKPDDSEIYDSTPIYALDDFAGGIFSQLTNPVNRWLELTIGDKDLAKWGPVKEWLYDGASALFSSMSPAVSSFYAQAPAWFASVGAFGLGSLGQEERIGEGRIADSVVPIGSTYIDTDKDGNVTVFDNRFALTGEQLIPFVKKLGGAVPDGVRDTTTYAVVHSVYQNPNVRPGMLGPQFMPWTGCYVSPDLRELRVEGGYEELPYHPIFWSKRTGRAYPRGPGHITLPDTNMLNEMERTHIVAAQFGAEPPLLLRDESVLSAADVVPNALLYGGMTERGEAAAGFLERKNSPQLSILQSQQRRDAIRTAFRFGLMQMLKDRPQMTATEFLGFQQQNLELMAPNLICVQIGLSSFIARRFRIMARARQIRPPPQELAGQSIGIEYVSPLAKAQKLGEGRAVIQLQQSIEQLALTDPGARDWFDGDTAAQTLGDAFTSVPGIIRTPKRVDDIRKARAAAQQQAVQLEQAAQAAEIGATVSHAMQAKTLSDKRIKAA